jgi:hypothetical protein
LCRFGCGKSPMLTLTHNSSPKKEFFHSQRAAASKDGNSFGERFDLPAQLSSLVRGYLSHSCSCFT